MQNADRAQETCYCGDLTTSSARRRTNLLRNQSNATTGMGTPQLAVASTQPRMRTHVGESIASQQHTQHRQAHNTLEDWSHVHHWCNAKSNNMCSSLMHAQTQLYSQRHLVSADAMPNTNFVNVHPKHTSINDA
jgi:hypothetical protein